VCTSNLNVKVHLARPPTFSDFARESAQVTARSVFVCSHKIRKGPIQVDKHYIASCAHGHTSTHRVQSARVHLQLHGAGRAERARRREALASGTAAVAAVAAAAASLSLRRHLRCHSRRRLHLHPPRFSAFPSARPSASAIHRCRPSLPPTPRRSPPPASTARIGHRHRRHLRRHRCQRERRLGRGRGIGLGYTAIR
jgi:hypothetical protein